MQRVFRVSERKACRAIRFPRVTHRYSSTRDTQAFLRMRIKEIASVRIRYGYRRIYILLRREGWQINHKRLYRIYREEGLNLRNKSKRKTISQARAPSPKTASKRNECWAMDFVSDQLYNGKKCVMSIEYPGKNHQEIPDFIKGLPGKNHDLVLAV